MNEIAKREQVKRLWFVQERLKRLAEERKQLSEEKRKGRVDQDIRQISRMRAYVLVRLPDLQQEMAALSDERKRLMSSLKSTKGDEQAADYGSPK
jgi:hypothetical protein